MATCILRITTYFGSTALNGELTNGTGQFAVLTEGKRMTHHHVCTAHQFGNFIHLTVFYNYSFFHTH